MITDLIGVKIEGWDGPQTIRGIWHDRGEVWLIVEMGDGRLNSTPFTGGTRIHKEKNAPSSD